MKTARTPIMPGLTPSMEECVKLAAEYDLPEAEGRKFFYHYESNGWKVGRNPIKSVAGAMGGWAERFKEQGASPATTKFQTRFSNGHYGTSSGQLSGADKMIKLDEYKRIVTRLDVLKTYDHLLPAHREEITRLRARRDVLKKELGIVI